MPSSLTAELIGRALGESVVERRGTIEQSITSVSVDSRAVAPGGLFVALPGERLDGSDFVVDAVARGAGAVVAERLPEEWPATTAAFRVADSLAALQRLAAWWRGRFAVRTIAITGSVGKTTTKEITAFLLAGGHPVLKSEGNLNNEVGLPLTLLKLTEEHERLVVEMGMYALGEIRLLSRIAQPDVGVVTCVRPIHLDRLGSIEAIARAKSELPEALPPDGLCVLNADDDLVATMRTKTPARVMTYGSERPADVTASSIESLGAEGITFTLGFAGERADVHLRLPGRHQVANALAAATVALADGMPLVEVAKRLSEVRDELRFRVRRGKGGATLLDDTYNAGPESVSADLGILADTPGRKIAVLGDMLELGEIEEEAHRRVGRRAAEVAEILFTYGPRARLIAEAAKEAGLSATRHFDDKQELSAALIAEIRAGDFVLLKASHGMALETVVEELEAGNEPW